MANLTRIKNNQITDKTIDANAKIVDYTITGRLFNPNITVTSDFLITGNLTVLGASTVTTVASTNTFVNDPLVVLNNGVSGSANTYDLGLLFNRGTNAATAFIWDETRDEFRLFYTSETGTSYGSITQSSLANIAVGNMTIQSNLTVTTIQANAGISGTSGNFSGNITMGGSGFSANTTNFALANATVQNFFLGGAATNVRIGAGTGNVYLNNGNVTILAATDTNEVNLAVGGTKLTFANNAPATVHAFGAATDLRIGAVSGTTYIQTGNLFLTSASGAGGSDRTNIAVGGTSLNFANIGINTANLLGEATSIRMGAGNGNVFLGTGNLTILGATNSNQVNIAVGGDTLLLANNAPATVNAFGNATDIRMGAATGSVIVNNPTILFTTATNIAVGGASLLLANNAPQTVNAFGAGTDVFFSSGTGNTTVRNNLNVNANEVVTGNVTILSTTPSTSYGTGALLVSGGISVGLNSTFNANVSIEGNLFVNGNVTYISSNNVTFNDALIYLADDNVADTLDIGFISSFTNPGYQHTGFVRDASDGVWKLFANVIPEPGTTVDFSNANYSSLQIGNLQVQSNVWVLDTFTANSGKVATSTSTGAIQITGTGGLGVGGNIWLGGSNIATSQSTVGVFNTNATNVLAFNAATDINMGATTGTITINNPTLVGTQATQAVYNTVATTVNAFGAATTLTIGATTGNTTIRTANVNLSGNANVQSTWDSTNFNNGALQVRGGVGVAGNVHLISGKQFIVGQDLVGEVYLPQATAQFFSNIAGYSQVNQQNISSNAFASSDFIATADNGNDSQGYIDFGINSSTYNQATFTITKANDGYLYVQGNATTGGGNLAIGTAQANNDIVFFTGGTLAANEAARFSDTNANLTISETTLATSPTTGALTVRGGVGIGSNLLVANGAVINYSQTSDNFTVWSATSGNALIRGNSTNEIVIIGGANATPQPSVTLKVDSTSAMMIPVGSNAQRPSALNGNNPAYDVKGMIRFNTNGNQLEFYNGTDWLITGTSTTTITGRQFEANTGNPYGNVNGVETTFTLQAAATTASTLVMINGVVQLPTISYSVSGANLIFTEAPALGDVIDARILTTTASVENLASADGYAQIIADSTGVGFWSGTVSSIQRVLVASNGTFQLVGGTKSVYDSANIVVTSGSTAYMIDFFSNSSYSTAKYIIQCKNGTNRIESMEALLVVEDSNASVVTYAVNSTTGNALGTLSANVTSGNVRLYYNTTSTNILGNVKVYAQYIV